MCGRYSQTKGWDGLAPRFKLEGAPRPIDRRYNIAPSHQAAGIGLRAGKREITQMRWGLIPSWVKDPKGESCPINARAETLALKPAFKTLLARRRCLVPADGFYEWKKEGSRKVPMRFHLPVPVAFAFAGLWDKWRGPDGKEIASFTIITTRPNDLCRQVHDRMPAILAEGEENAWLDPSADPARLLPLLRPYEGEMYCHEVSPFVNNPANDELECITPISR